jgi:SSS family solute:Na+ symporter
MVLSALVAPLIGGFEGLFHYLQTALAFLVPPVVVIFLFGLCCRRAGAAAALATLAGGHAISAGCFIATLTGGLDLHFTLIAGLIFGVSAVIYALVYRATRHAVPAVAERYVWHPATARATVAGGWWRDYRVHGAALLLLTLWLVLAFA